MKKVFVFISVFFVISCSNVYIGKDVPITYPRGTLSEQEGHHSLVYEHLILDYDYQIDKRLGTIECKGFIHYRPENVHIGTRAVGMRFNALFIDSNLVIVASEEFRFPDHEMRKNIPFQRTFKYDPAFGSIAFNYNFSYY
jgi:hypothetical protein